MKIQWWRLTGLVVAIVFIHAGPAGHVSAWTISYAHGFASAGDPPVTSGISA
ncbi:MAG: hypothetical protein M0Z36_11060 [Thermaerobacter sp.]|nr:hypothetical protein [Thermaerobacter sp.]